MLYISASFLTYYAAKAKDAQALEILRNYAFAWSFPTIMISLLAFLVLSEHNPVHFQSMLSLLGSLVYPSFAFAICLFNVEEKIIRLGFCVDYASICLAFFGYGFSHLQYLLYPHLTG